MANLAIKGHETRGSEVIALLEMLGGINHFLQGGWGKGIYLIDPRDNIIYYIQLKDIVDDFTIFTLEEFLEKFPYKVGDKVKTKHPDTEGTLIDEIVDMIWDVDKVLYELSSSNLLYFYAEELQPYKEETMEGKLVCNEDNKGMYLKIDQTLLRNPQIIFSIDSPDKTELVLGDNFEVKVKEDKTYVVRKQLQYPNTYNECWKILDAGEEEVVFDGATASEEVLLDSFIKLKRCRDAYWKIAGDWKPNLGEDFIYAIGTCYGAVGKRMVTGGSGILLFPTEEMRDTFYDNFKDLIEQCEELL